MIFNGTHAISHLIEGLERIFPGARRMAMRQVGLEDFQLVRDDEVGLALPLGAIGGAAPAVGVGPRLQVLVESEVVQAQIDPTARAQVKLDW